MIKSFLIVLNLLGAMFFHLFMADGIVIEDNTPKSMAPGSKRLVEITINKGDLSGFAKLQLDLPANMSAVANQTRGASFTYSGQKAKFIWMAMPNEEVFTVSYYLEADESANGNKVIQGSFAYVKDNQRVDYQLKSKVVQIDPNAVEEEIAQEPKPATTTTASASTQKAVSCQRFVNLISDHEYLVELKVSNSDLNGFVKIIDRVPAGYTITEEDSDGAVPTIEQTTAKYVWFEAPALKSFQVSYKLSKSVQAGDLAFDGTFAYVQDNTPQENSINTFGEVPQTLVAQEKPQTTAKTEAVAENKVAPKTETPAVITPPLVKAKESATEKEAIASVPAEGAAKSEVANKSGSSIPQPEKGVTYKVQIMAAHKTVGKSYFQSRHKFNEPFGIENHEGWVKYTTGQFPEYKQARDKRVDIHSQYNFNGPFVTAYNNGQRITVQEALMISKQPWFQ